MTVRDGGSYDFSDPQSFNRYAYVGSDPVNRSDPSGLDGDPDFGSGPPPPVPILVPRGPIDRIIINAPGQRWSNDPTLGAVLAALTGDGLRRHVW